MTEVARQDTIEASFESDPYADAQGFELGEITAESVGVSMVVRGDHLTFHGVLPG